MFHFQNYKKQSIWLGHTTILQRLTEAMEAVVSGGNPSHRKTSWRGFCL